MENKDIYEDISSIKTIMERSAKFISLSGLAGVMAGIYALAGVVAVCLLPAKIDFFMNGEASFAKNLLHLSDGSLEKFQSRHPFNIVFKDERIIILIGAIVMLLSIATGMYLTRKKAKNRHQTIWNESSRTLLRSAIVPLITGALLVTITLIKGDVSMIFPWSLIFYGLALTAASKYTYGDVKWLGFLEVSLGLIGMIFINAGLFFWAIGFGVLHILYGAIMYFKYDRGNNAA